jgi:hypothetical protein
LQRIIQSVLHRTRTQLSEAEEELIRATQFAEARERLLLTAQGPALVTAVKQALEALGFEIETGGGHGIPDAATEDLRVASPDDPNWEAVVQIHAREEGVTPDDVLQLYMCRSRYEREKGREPPRAWCVVNQVMGKDPFERQELFKACKEYIPALSEDGALLLDTSVLLELWLAVQREAVSWEGARHLLMNAKGCLVSDDVVQLTKQEDGGRSGPA